MQIIYLPQNDKPKIFLISFFLLPTLYWVELLPSDLKTGLSLSRDRWFVWSLCVGFIGLFKYTDQLFSLRSQAAKWPTTRFIPKQPNDKHEIYRFVYAAQTAEWKVPVKVQLLFIRGACSVCTHGGNTIQGWIKNLTVGGASWTIHNSLKNTRHWKLDNPSNLFKMFKYLFVLT